jgi:SAM-dependent methyltransferase
VGTLTFDAEMGRLQRALAQCHDMVVRRSVVLQALALRPGERVLELGCGGGACAYEAARFVGPGGLVSAIDISADQVAAARARCAELAWVECRVADAASLPHGSGQLDAVYGVQVLEYVADLGKALRKIRRVLRPGGRLINFATNWSSVVWHSEHPARMTRMLAAFSPHAPYHDLPAVLPAGLRRAGLQLVRQRPVPVLNGSYGENGFSFWLSKVIAEYAVGRDAVTRDEAGAWLADFRALDEDGANFFCSTPVLTEAMRV